MKWVGLLGGVNTKLQISSTINFIKKNWGTYVVKTYHCVVDNPHLLLVLLSSSLFSQYDQSPSEGVILITNFFISFLWQFKSLLDKVIHFKSLKFRNQIWIQKRFGTIVEGPLDQWCELGFYGLSYSFLPVFLMVVDPSHKSSENSLSESFGQP